MSRGQLAALLVSLAMLVDLGPGCVPAAPPLRPELRAAADRHDALALWDALEQLIDAGQDTTADREAAYEVVCRWHEDTAAHAFARAALAGRLAQTGGLGAVGLVAEVERFGRRSVALDPHFRGGIARRMLGTLYVLAPGAFVEHGDSEMGLEMLEKLVAERPAELENHLRLAEAYIALGDPEPAFRSLCACLADSRRLRPDSQRLLGRLLQDVGGRGGLGCDE